MSNQQPQFDSRFFELLVQYATLQDKLAKYVAPASQKLVRDLVNSGCKVERVAKAVGRNPGFIRAVMAGQRALTLQQTVRVLRHGISSGESLVKK